MEYKFEEYERVIDTPKKKLEERAIVEKIISLLNKNKFKSIDDFCKENSDYVNFKKNNDMENVLKHFGNKLNQNEYDMIIQSLRKMIKNKSTFDTNEIKTTNIDDKQYVSYEGKDENYYLNNSFSNESIEKQMDDIQKQMSSLQTSNPKENTDLIMKEMKKNKKISLILRYLNEINFEILTEEQQDLFKFAFEYQQKNDGLIRIDLDEKVMVDEDDNIMKIDKVDGNFVINKGDDNYTTTSDVKDTEIDENKHNNTKKINLMPKTQLFS